jgi:formylglycine-generating enzyme required for sulfatase activity
MTAHNHIIFRITIVAFLAAFLTFIPGCGGDDKDGASVESRGDEEDLAPDYRAEKGEYDKAIADCTEAIRLDPKHVEAYHNRGVAYWNKGEYDKAIADFTEAIRLEPTNDFYRKNLKDAKTFVKCELQIVYSQRETNNPNWRPPAGHTVQTSEGWDKETGCAVEIEHEKSGIVLRLVPAGEFDMGSQISPEEAARKHGGQAEWYIDEYPLHKVKISEPFYIGKYEVTQKQWKAVMGSNPSRWTGDNLPVEKVNWNNAQAFCRKAGGGLRLPSEAEWEYACRAGSKARWCFGDNEGTRGEYAWYWGNRDFKTHKVGKKKPNAWGLYDIHGNVWEWCEDVWHSNYNGAPSDGRAWTTGGDQSSRVCRGGSWVLVAGSSRSAFRCRIVPGDTYFFFGFRVVAAAGAVRSGDKIVYSQRETNNPNWRPSEGYKVHTGEGWDKETGCAVEIVHEKSGIVLRLVPAGEFGMGLHISAEEVARKFGVKAAFYKGEHPLHRVKISEPFYIGKYEVTQKQWKAVMGDNPSEFKGDNLPVEGVTWEKVQEFCRKGGGGLRLPSEAEWEYACRAGRRTRWCFGDNVSVLGEYAWYYENSKGKTHEVGTRKPNDWGIYDMHGNVWECCEDWYDSNYYEKCRNGVTDPQGPSNGKYRVWRGGSWLDDAWFSRSAFRFSIVPGDLNNYFLGFRVVVAGAVR